MVLCGSGGAVDIVRAVGTLFHFNFIKNGEKNYKIHGLCGVCVLCAPLREMMIIMQK